MGLILQAASFAAQKHRHQRRKDAEQTPYINHPLAVAQMLSEVALPDAVMIAAALLHDTVEDTDTALEEIEQSFGTDVRQVVAEVTDDKSLPKAVRKQRQIEHAGCVSDRAKLIKLADKIANIRDVVLNPPAHWSSDRKLAYLDWAKQVIDQIRGIHPDLETRFDHWYEQGKQSLDANHSE
ncbi:MAG: bifunctional (p)ppGpp synthetase/guanosine-3',5'-bis(diphosphate) 3'-pyrophosphohydrolase [Leptolyngbyaceae cyanobacterium SL_1_1]|nr:bifunctional (p)ppGpp synthetase/guanosine-3',5'-bis(diphosphate) 3'-pyrophosphohydrolase [Leptolyngbyaceae cyanobacterium SL_1_1]